MSDPANVALEMPAAATVIVFVSVAITAAGFAYRIVYRGKPSGSPPAVPPPLPMTAIAAVYCPVCGVQNRPGAAMCACGYNLGSIKMPSSPQAGSARNRWEIADEASARNAARQGMWGAFLVAIVTAVVAFLAGSGVKLIDGVGPLAWIDAAAFALLGVGIKNMNRAAAVGALLLYLVEQIALAGHAGFNVAMIAMVLSFVQGVRGTFAFHKYRERLQLA